MAPARDISGNGHHGSYVGQFGPTASLVPTDADPAARFNVGYVVADAAIAGLAGAAVVTMGLWVRPTTATELVVMGINPVAFDYNRYGITHTSSLAGFGRYHLDTTSAAHLPQITTEAGNPHPLGAVTFVVGKFSPSAQVLYIDGAPVATTAYVGRGVPAADDRLSIGQDYDGAGPGDTSQEWVGDLDDAFIFDYGLSDGQVAALYAAGASGGGFRAAVLALGPVGYWRLNDLGGFMVGAVAIG